jgi:hypothetical protein
MSNGALEAEEDEDEDDEVDAASSSSVLPFRSFILEWWDRVELAVVDCEFVAALLPITFCIFLIFFCV